MAFWRGVKDEKKGHNGGRKRDDSTEEAAKQTLANFNQSDRFVGNLLKEQPITKRPGEAG